MSEVPLCIASPPLVACSYRGHGGISLSRRFGGISLKSLVSLRSLSPSSGGPGHEEDQDLHSRPAPPPYK